MEFHIAKKILRKSIRLRGNLSCSEILLLTPRGISLYQHVSKECGRALGDQRKIEVEE